MKIKNALGGYYDTQIVMLDTIMGPQPRYAPAGFEFDKTAILAWCRLIHCHVRLDAPSKTTKKYIASIQAQIDILGEVLAASLGFSTFYWTIAGRDFKNATT